MTAVDTRIESLPIEAADHAEACGPYLIWEVVPWGLSGPGDCAYTATEAEEKCAYYASFGGEFTYTIDRE